MRRRGESQTDSAKVKAMTEEELEASIAADPDDVHDPIDWSTAIKGLPPGVWDVPRKQDVHIRLDSDVVQWFRGQGRGYQTRINAVLRAFVEHQKKSAA
jgi:uncharacterized protein (DUF4415 family)